ncbi:MAG: DUF5711 family protein [Eubacteriales bacterium]|nr:DUF5711 family protein [Eubacteriales bacterium]
MDRIKKRKTTESPSESPSAQVKKLRMNFRLPKLSESRLWRFFLTIGRKTRSLFLLSILSFVLMLILLIWVLASQAKSGLKGQLQATPSSHQRMALVESESESIYPFAASYLLRVNTDQVSLLSNDGHEELSTAISCASPIVRSNSKYALVFDLNGHRYYLFDRNGLVYQGQCPDPISFASVSNYGHVALIMENGSTRGILRIMDPEGLHLFDYEVRERKESGYILACNFTSDGQYLDLSMFNTDGVDTFPMINRFDLLASKRSAVYSCDTDEALPLLCEGSDNQLIAIGNHSVYRLFGDQMNLWLQFADIKQALSNGDGLVLLAADSVKGEPRLVYKTFDSDLGTFGMADLNSISVGAEPSLLTCNGQYAAVVDDRLVYRVRLSDLSVEKFEQSSNVLKLQLDEEGHLTVITKQAVLVY